MSLNRMLWDVLWASKIYTEILRVQSDLNDAHISTGLRQIYVEWKKTRDI
jgi:hypothetical protein